MFCHLEYANKTRLAYSQSNQYCPEYGLDVNQEILQNLVSDWKRDIS
jgi:hypothetical protein